MQLDVAREHRDGPIAEHSNEPIDSLEARGIKATPKDGQDDGGWKMWMWTAGTETVTETSRCPKPVPELCTDVEILELGVSDISRGIRALQSEILISVAIATCIQTLFKGSSTSDASGPVCV